MQDHKSQPLTDFIEYPPEEMLERANEFLQTSQRRHSIRSFSNRQVPKEIIETCIKAAGTAPSGANQQPWDFVANNNAEGGRKSVVEGKGVDLGGSGIL